MLKPIDYNVFKNNISKYIENIIKKKNDYLIISDKSKLNLMIFQRSSNS